jgi:hypothetical protein
MLYDEIEKSFVVRPSYAHDVTRGLTKEKKERSQVTKGVDRIGGVTDSHTLKRCCEGDHNPVLHIHIYIHYIQIHIFVPQLQGRP